MSNGITSSITKAGRFEPFELQISRNQILGHQPVSIFGYTSGIGDTTTPQTIWELANNATQKNYTYLATAANLSVVSTSASDTNTVFITGLDSNFNLLSESLTLTGTTPAISANSYLRINGLYYNNSSNVGTITASVSAVVYGQINAGVGQTQMAQYTVPRGYTFYLTFFQANSSLASQAVLFQQQDIYNLTSSTMLNGYSIPHNQNTIQSLTTPFSNGLFDLTFGCPIPYTQGTDIQFQAKTLSGGINGSVAAFAGGFLVQNDNLVTGSGS